MAVVRTSLPYGTCVALTVAGGASLVVDSTLVSMPFFSPSVVSVVPASGRSSVRVCDCGVSGTVTRIGRRVTRSGDCDSTADRDRRSANLTRVNDGADRHDGGVDADVGVVMMERDGDWSLSPWLRASNASRVTSSFQSRMDMRDWVAVLNVCI